MCAAVRCGTPGCPPPGCPPPGCGPASREARKPSAASRALSRDACCCCCCCCCCWAHAAAAPALAVGAAHWVTGRSASLKVAESALGRRSVEVMLSAGHGRLKRLQRSAWVAIRSLGN